MSRPPGVLPRCSSVVAKRRRGGGGSNKRGADGSPFAAEKLARVLSNDPAIGVIRHADAGYDEAIEVADRLHVRIPIREGSASEDRP